MALPKKLKYDIDINPVKTGTEYMKFGIERIEELMRQTDVKTKYLPRTINLEDIDFAMFDYINNDNMKIVIDGNAVPVFYLDNDRWGEFSKTWKFVDDDKNIPTPYVTVRRTNKGKGTRLGTKHRIPQPMRFTYLNIPILDNGQIIYLVMKMPEPVNVDLTYEISLFTKYRVDVNQFDEQVLENFASEQDYLFINGNPIPIKFEGFNESNPIENIDGDKLFISKYTILTMGFIQNEDNYEIVKSTRTPKIGYIVS